MAMEAKVLLAIILVCWIICAITDEFRNDK